MQIALRFVLGAGVTCVILHLGIKSFCSWIIYNPIQPKADNKSLTCETLKARSLKPKKNEIKAHKPKARKPL